MGLFDGYGQAAASELKAVWERLLCSLDALRQKTGDVETGTTGTARTLAYQYGVPPQPGTARLVPRSMLALPLVREGTLTQRVTLNVLEDDGRYVYAGYLANIGDEPYRAAWLGVDGSTSGFFTMPPGVTVQVPCIICGLLIEPVTAGTSITYQAALS